MFIRASRHDFQVTAADDMASWLRASNTPSLDEIASKLAQLRDRIPPPPPPVAPTVELGPDYAHATIAPVRRVERAARVECRVACTQTVHAVRQLSPHQRQRRNTGGLLAPGMTLAPRRVCRHLSWLSAGRACEGAADGAQPPSFPVCSSTSTVSSPADDSMQAATVVASLCTRIILTPHPAQSRVV